MTICCHLIVCWLCFNYLQAFGQYFALELRHLLIRVIILRVEIIHQLLYILVLPVLRHTYLQHTHQLRLLQQLGSTYREDAFQSLMSMTFHDEHIGSQLSLLHASIKDI